jgi:quercetin dioxygenase-like cupin family protein
MKHVSFDEIATEKLSPEVTRQRVTGEALELVRYEYAAGARFSEHSHEAEQLTWVTEGALVFVFADEEVRVDAGQAVLIEGGRRHAAFVPDDAGTTKTLNVFTPVRDELPQA